MPDAPATPTPPDRAAFDRTAPARAALPLDQAPSYTLDAVHAAAQALGIARRLAPHRDAIVRLPDFDLGHLDHLPDYANALLFVQWTLAARAERVRQLPALAQEGYQARDLLLAYAELLMLKGQVAPEVIKRLRLGAGYRDLVEDLGALVTLLRDNVGRDGALASPDELAHAMDVAAALTVALGAGADPDLDRDTLVAERRKLGALLVRAQTQLRRAMVYLRFDEKDAAELVPSVYVPGRRRGRGGKGAVDPVAASRAPAGVDGPFEG